MTPTQRLTARAIGRAPVHDLARRLGLPDEPTWDSDPNVILRHHLRTAIDRHERALVEFGVAVRLANAAVAASVPVIAAGLTS